MLLQNRLLIFTNIIKRQRKRERDSERKKERDSEKKRVRQKLLIRIEKLIFH